MKNRRKLIIILALLAVPLVGAAGFFAGTALLNSNAEFFISPTGNDKNPGTLSKPFETIERAQQAVRDLKASKKLPKKGVVVWLREGVYVRNSSIVLNEADSGTEGAPVVYSAYKGETVRIVGSATLEPSWFTKVTEASPVWGRIDPSARGNLMQVTLSDHNITDYGKLAMRGNGSTASAALELFFNQQPMTLGRWPDAGVNSGNDGDPDQIVQGFALTSMVNSDQQFMYSGSEPERWSQAEDIWFHGLWRYPWADYHTKCESIDTQSKTITIDKLPKYDIGVGQYYYAENLLEEITQSREWYLNRSTGILYFWPPSPLDKGETMVSMMKTPLLTLVCASNVIIKDITFEMGRDVLVQINGGSDNQLYNCTIRNAGTTGVTITGTNNGLERCEISQTGDGGVIITGGDRASLTSGNDYVRNCKIHNFGRWAYDDEEAVILNGCGNIVAHNEIYDSPHAAILFTGNNHLIDYNKIYNVCNLSSDCGAIYSGRDWGYRGNMIRYNFIYDISSPLKGSGVHGIYFDDCVSGNTAYGNVLNNIDSHAILLGGGRDDIVENNVIVKCGGQMLTDNRGLTSINNIPGNSFNLLERLSEDGIKYQSEPWRSAYPALAKIPNDWAQISDPHQHWRYPEGSVFTRNIGFEDKIWIMVNNEPYTTTLDKFANISDNVQNADPLFVDEANFNLALKPESPAFKIPGFQAIPFDKIGIEQLPK